MNTFDFFVEFGSSMVWPLVVLLVILTVLRQAWTELHPIFVGMVNNLAKSAASNANLVGLALLFGVSASLSAFWDVFHEMTRQNLMAMSWHQYLASWTKVLNPFIVAFLAKMLPAPPKAINTTPPFSSTP